MRDIIQLLPDAVANQIAAGEVVQRPASVVKELLENSVDAGATEIQLIVNNAGKTQIQVIDNGAGMTETDARMAFERHATSKIRKAEDLFKITSMGFRGEALASIAAVAQVHCKTKRDGDELGSELKIEGSKVTAQSYCQTPTGTIISVKNLFFNIPARRNFLKSDQVEFKHLIDEFERVAMANSRVAFSLLHNQNSVFNLPSGNLRQRIAGILGKKYNERLVPVQEQTSIVNLTGFVLKPEFARKTRGEQFFFVNNRYIRNNYLHYAINDAFQGLLSPDQHPGYVLFMEIDPAHIDVNIHPTKTEIKFDDEKSIFAIIRSSVKHALGQYNVVPTLDFERENAISVPPLKRGETVKMPGITVDPNFNPFASSTTPTAKGGGGLGYQKPAQSAQNTNWEALFKSETENVGAQLDLSQMHHDKHTAESGTLLQLQGGYMVRGTANGLMLLHKNRAHQRVLYEQFQRQFENQTGVSQQLLFPQQLNLPSGDLALLADFADDLRQMGFDIEFFGQQQLVVQGIPLALKESESLQALEEIIEDIKHDSRQFSLNKWHQMALIMARYGAIKPSRTLSAPEMEQLLADLFSCKMPQYCPAGKPTMVTLGANELENFFN